MACKARSTQMMHTGPRAAVIILDGWIAFGDELINGKSLPAKASQDVYDSADSAGCL